MIRLLVSWLKDLAMERSIKRFAMARVLIRFNSYASGYQYKARDFKE